MKHTLTFILPCLLGLNFIHAQEATEEIDIEARKASIGNLEMHIAQREEHLAETSEDIIRLDKRVEGGVDQIVTMLASISDSQDSKTRISNIKGDAIEGLKNMIDYYQRKRAEVRESLRTGKTDVPLEELSSDVDVFDERIEKRIEQIVDLTKSFTQHEDYNKYVTTGGGGGWRGWGWQNQEVSEAWRQNRRDTRKTSQNRDEAIEALKKSIDDLDQRQKYLKEKLRTGNISETEKKLYESDIERIDGIVAARQGQLEELVTTIDQPATKSVGRNQAYEIDKLLEDAKVDLRNEFFEIFRKYDELNRERGQIAALKENLIARKKWIEEYEAKQ